MPPKTTPACSIAGVRANIKTQARVQHFQEEKTTSS